MSASQASVRHPARPGRAGARGSFALPGLAWAAALALLTAVAYAGLPELGFVLYDDPGYVVGNRQVQQGLSPDALAWAWQTTRLGNWHPLTWMSHMAVWELAGAEAWAHHLANGLLHLANGLLLFAVLGRATGRLAPSALVAALFAVHPLHVESVAWVAERKDVLSSFFGLLVLAAYLRFARCGGRAAWWAALAAFVASLLAKPMLVTLPCVLLLLDVWPLGRLPAAALRGPGGLRRLGGLALEKLPFFALSLLFAGVALVSQQEGGALRGLAELGPGERLVHALRAYAVYLGQTFWPRDLVVFYPLPETLPLAQAALAALLLVGVTALAWRSVARFPFFLVGWLWFVGTLVPVIGLVQVGSQAHADRYTYWPHIGLFMALAWGWEALARRVALPRTLAWAAPVCAVLALVPLTRAQVALWRDDVALFEHALAVDERNFVAHFFLGERARAAGDWEKAAAHLERSRQLDPGHAVVHNNLGNVRAAQGRAAAAIEAYRDALERAPGYAAARGNLGVLLLRQGRVEEAVATLRRALRDAEPAPDPHLNLASALLRAGEAAEAIAHQEEALRLARAQGDREARLRALRPLARLRASHPDPALRDGEAALRHAQEALALEGSGHPVDLDHRAQALAELGRFDEAARTTLRALQKIPPERRDLREPLRARLQLYRAGRPYRLDPAALE